MRVWWIKKDFRLLDNPALSQAVSGSWETVLAVFILEPSSIRAPETSYRHIQAQLTAFANLRVILRNQGGDCLLIVDEVITVLDKLHARNRISAIYSHEEVGLLRTFNRDKLVQAWCKHNAVIWNEYQQTGVFRGLDDRDKREYRWQKWIKEGPLPSPPSNTLRRLRIPEHIKREWPGEVPTCNDLNQGVSRRQLVSLQRTDTDHAQSVLSSFLYERGIAYSGGISSPNTAFEAGSRLSTHLAWGTISIRTVYAQTMGRLAELTTERDEEAVRFKRSLRAFFSRLHWRDHFIQRLETESDMELYALNRAYDNLYANENPVFLEAWINGQTGYPLVDACIRCAQETGFLNFRMRSLITSVATHCLGLDWRSIHCPMAQWWTDFEPGIHLAQLQMQAGVVGINTLRVYSPYKQMEDHDPEAIFIKRWVPELRDHSAAEIRKIETAPLKHYRRPLISWRQSTQAMKAEYFAIKNQDTTRKLAEEVLLKHGSRKSPSKSKATRKSAMRKKGSAPMQHELF